MKRNTPGCPALQELQMAAQKSFVTGDRQKIEAKHTWFSCPSGTSTMAGSMALD